MTQDSKPKCSINPCDRPVLSRGWCGMHYQRWQYRKGGDPEPGRRYRTDPESFRGSKNPNWRGGKSAHPLIDIYRDMVNRCHRESHVRYRDYGGRGIQVCQEWRDDFWTFVAYVGERPPGITKGGRALYQIDRIDNDGNYEPGNVKWSTPSEQSRNKRGYGDGEERRDRVTGRYNAREK